MGPVIFSDTAAILAGGRSRRFGANKALAPWKDSTVLGQMLGVLRPLFARTLIVAKDPALYAAYADERTVLVADRYARTHAAGGIETALAAARSPRVFVAACDMPLLGAPLIRALMAAAAADYQAVVPLWQGRRQALCGVYRRSLGPLLRRRIAEDDFRLAGLFDAVRTRFFSEDEVRACDPEGLGLSDIDTPEQYQFLRSRSTEETYAQYRRR